MVRIDSRAGSLPRFPLNVVGATVERMESRLLAGNPLGDPAERGIAVYRPPSGTTEGLPLLILLGGFASGGVHQAARPQFLAETELGLFDRLVRTGAMPEAVLIVPDCLTSLGGSQYVNSAATGRYADFVLQEVIPWAREELGTGPMGILGQSSGGFGALHLAIESPGTFAAVGTSAGDMAFELTVRPDIAPAVRTYRRFGGPEAFLRKLAEEPWMVRAPNDPTGAALLLLALGACYSPRSGSGAEFDLPFDLDTGELIPSVWQRWLDFDPVLRVERPDVRSALGRVGLVYLTASSEDEWFLDLAARRLAGRMARHGLSVRYDEFPGSHFDKRLRFQALFPALVGALTGGEVRR